MQSRLHCRWSSRATGRKTGHDGMIKARLALCGEAAGMVAAAIEPDNLPNMTLLAEDDRMLLEFSTEKIGTLLSTVDDLLMNIKIAEETQYCTEER